MMPSSSSSSSLFPFPIVSNCSILFFLAIFSTEFVPSSAGIGFWSFSKVFSSTELPQATQAMLDELDEVDSVLTERMSKVILTIPPSPAHPKFQELYLDNKQMFAGPSRAENEKNCQTFGQDQQKIKKKVRLEKICSSILPKSAIVKQTERIVQVYQHVKDNHAGGWGELMRKMFTNMVLAKQNGEGDAAELRNNCQTALQLAQKEGGAAGVQLDKIKPFNDTWSLVKSAAQSVLELFKGAIGGNGGDEKNRMKRTETFLRVLKTLADDSKTIEGKAGLKMRRRRRKRLASLIIVGIVIAALCVMAFVAELSRAH